MSENDPMVRWHTNPVVLICGDGRETGLREYERSVVGGVRGRGPPPRQVHHVEAGLVAVHRVQDYLHTVWLFINRWTFLTTNQEPHARDTSMKVLPIMSVTCHRNSLSCFNKYPSSRELTIRIKNQLCYTLLATGGVPQGSYLGPLMFLYFTKLFIN